MNPNWTWFFVGMIAGWFLVPMIMPLVRKVLP